MDARTQPNLNLAKKILPKPLFEVLIYLINQQLDDCALVGGTALSGFYTGHRRSDDLDLFTKDPFSFRATLLAVQSLKSKSVVFLKETTSAFYYNANCKFKNHLFTVDIVLDKNLFDVGEFFSVGDTLKIASLSTLLSMKSAALVSRASEKDINDIIQLFDIFSNLSIQEFIALGKTIDRGVNPEAMLAAVGGANLRQEACNFSLDPAKTQQIVYNEILVFRKKLINSLQEYLKSQTPQPLGQLIALTKKILK